MSETSFPRAEHVALLRQRIESCVRQHIPFLQVEERGVNHLKCQYRFGMRNGQDGPWKELAIHFQVAERLQAGGGDAELGRLIARFLFSEFAERPSPADESKTGAE